MSDINTYMSKLSTQLVMDAAKRDKIENSLSRFKKEIWGLFQNKLSDCSVFGSYDRETIITVDDDSDVDILIVFKKNEFQPDTYLKHIKDFCENKYSRSDIYPDHPTIVVEMEHVKFELVPAIYHYDTTVKIPAPRSKDLKWITTNPSEFKSKVERKDKNNKGLILPIIRVFKYWNLLQGKPFSSFEIEKAIIERMYTCETIRDYYFSATSSFEDIIRTEEQKKSYGALKERNRRLRILEQNKLLEYIEPELESFVPTI